MAKLNAEPGADKNPTDADPTTLAIDIGGTGLKAAVLDDQGTMATARVRVATTYPCPPDRLIEQLAQLVAPLPAFDRVAVGFPGVVRDGVITSAPHFVRRAGPGSRADDTLTAAWHQFDLAAALKRCLARPVLIANDADVHGVHVVSGIGVELVITLGTGLGVSIFEKGRLGPHLELAQHPFRHGRTYNQEIGDAARKKVGNRRWRRRMRRVVAALDALVFYDHLYIGGGNARHLLGDLGPAATIIDNDAGLLGGFELWSKLPR